MNLLSKLFPPKLPRINDWEPTVGILDAEQGSCGNVRRKQYANGIERHFAEAGETRCKLYFGVTYAQYLAQMLYAEQEMKRHTDALIAAGYVNTIHDEWEPNADWHLTKSGN